MIGWTLPAPRPHLGVRVRVGERGPVVPMVRGAVLVAGAAQLGAQMQVRYPVTGADLALRVSIRDLARVAPRGGTAELVATVYHAQGTETHRLGVPVTDEAPDGLVFALVTADGTYLTAEGLPDAGLSLRVVCEDGTSYPAESPGRGVTFAPGQTARPAQVYASDDEGRESADLLAGVEAEHGGDGRATEFAAWPLPPYLRADRPVTRAFLRAFEAALDVRPDEAGRFLSPLTSSGVPLTHMGKLYGVSRVDAPDDAAMSRRILATQTRNKGSLAGLEAMLRAHGIFGGRVEDLMSVTGGRPLTLDGSWLLDGRRALDGGASGWNLRAGEVMGVFRRAPAGGLGPALAVLRRYKSAGIRTRVMLRQGGDAELPQPGTHARLTRRVTLPAVRVKSPFLTLDGSWPLDGRETLDGLRG